MLPNDYRTSYLARDYNSPTKNSISRNSYSLSHRPTTYNYNNSPRPMMNIKNRQDSFDQVGEKMRLMKSRLGNLSIHSKHQFSQNNLYPTQLIFLLSNEEGNVDHMKKLIQQEKKRVNRDFQNLSRQIFHLIQDLKLSIQSQLDQVFKDFIEIYKSLKNQVVLMRQNRKKILQNRPPQQFERMPTRVKQANNNISNLNLLQQISKDEDYFKNHKIYEEITNAYYEAIGPIMIDCQNILALGSEIQFYKDQRCNQFLNNLRHSFYSNTRLIFDNELDNLVTQAKHIIEDRNMLLKDLNIQQQKYEKSEDNLSKYNDKQKNSNAYTNNHSSMNLNINKKKRAQTEANPYGIQPPSFKNNINNGQIEKHKNLRPPSSSEYLTPRQRPQLQWQSRRKQFQPQKLAKKAKIKTTKDQQNAICEQLEFPKLIKVNTNINGSESRDILLCLVFINSGKQIAVGGKDKNIYIFSTTNGKLTQTLSAHKASVCSLSNFNSFFASGGDNGCGSLILWEQNQQQWRMRKKSNLHSAALTCIVDVLDGVNLATGGYDKKIQIFNYIKGQCSFQVSSCRSGVTSMVVCQRSRKLISAGLDSTLTIWNIFTRNGQLESISLERIVTNCGLTCSLRSLTLAYDIVLVGNKDGRVMIVNIHTGQITKTLTVGRGSVIQMNAIQRQNKPLNPIVVSYCNGQRQICFTKTDTGISQFSKCKANISFGCGIGPKIVFDSSGILAIVSQNQVQKQVAIYNLQTN